AGDPTAGEDQIAAWVEVRLNRQRVLTRDDPVEFKAVIDEAALRRLVGGEAVMREQPRHLLPMVGRPNGEGRVLTFSVGAHASMRDTFEIFEMQAPYPDAGYMESRAGAIYLEGEDVEALEQAYDRLVNTALEPDESAGMIGAITEELG